MATATALPPNIEALARKPRAEQLRNILREQLEALSADKLARLETFAARRQFNVLSALDSPRGTLPEGQLLTADGLKIVHHGDFVLMSQTKHAEQIAEELKAALKEVLANMRQAEDDDAARAKRIEESTKAFEAKQERERLERLQNDPLWRIEQLEAAVDSIRKHLKIL